MDWLITDWLVVDRFFADWLFGSRTFTALCIKRAISKIKPYILRTRKENNF
jgi:hypothetical protein